MYDEIAADTKERETIKVVHLSDVHIDFDYSESSLWMCGSYVCCRKEWGVPDEPILQAGQWGGYECDTPVQTLQSALDHIKDTINPDMLFWTGDNSPHDTYANTEQQVIDYTLHVTTMLKDTFKGTSTQMYPTTGNHDTWPVNIMNFDKPG
jgi:sphingomyelin phosphodiesterase